MNPNGADQSMGSQETEPTGPTFLQRVILLFTAPAKSFLPRRDFTLWLIPILIVAGLGIVSSVMLKDLYLEQQKNFFRESSLFPEEQREELIARLEAQRDGSSPVGAIAQSATGAVVSTGLFFFLPALFYFLILKFGMGAVTRYGDILGVVSFSALLLAAREILTLPLKLSQGNLDVFTSPAAFVSPDAGLLFQICNVLDLFHLYRLLVLTVGFAVVARVSVRSAAILVIGVWAAWSIMWIPLKLSPFGPMLPALVP